MFYFILVFCYSQDTIPPTLLEIHIQSSNSNHSLAYIGETITLTVVSSEPLLSIRITIAGVNAQIKSRDNGLGLHWAGEIILVGTETGLQFTIYYYDYSGNVGQTRTETTDGSFVLLGLWLFLF